MDTLGWVAIAILYVLIKLSFLATPFILFVYLIKKEIRKKMLLK